jgi:hypothetical protein
MSPRNVTGAFVIETDRGWFRAPFPPVHVARDPNAIESAYIFATLPQPATIRNVWLAQAASDESQWKERGVVSCAPAPERHTPAPAPVTSKTGAVTIAASAIPAPFSYDCKTPFSNAVPSPDTMDGDVYAPGQYAAALVFLDAQGNVIDVTGIDASGDDFTMKKKIEDRVKHMRFTPAKAYCRPVPSYGIVRESAGGFTQIY